jgi:hypothetical protein
MVSINEFRADSKAINEGDWVRVDSARYGDLEILTRGFTDDFIDAQNARTEKLAESFMGDRTRILNSDMRKMNASLIEDYLVIDVRNLTDEKGEPVSVALFHAMLYQPEYARLARASWAAAARISTRSVAQMEDARGNLPKPSASASNGGTSALN